MIPGFAKRECSGRQCVAMRVTFPVNPLLCNIPYHVLLFEI